MGATDTADLLTSTFNTLEGPPGTCTSSTKVGVDEQVHGEIEGVEPVLSTAGRVLEVDVPVRSAVAARRRRGRRRR